MNKKLMLIPALLLSSGLMLTGCAQETVTTTETETSSDSSTTVTTETTTKTKDKDESTDKSELSESAAALLALTVSHQFLNGTVEEGATATPAFYKTYTEAKKAFANISEVNPDITAELRAQNPSINGDDVTVKGDKAVVELEFPEVKGSSGVDESADAAIHLEKIDDKWLVSDVMISEGGEDYSYIKLMDEFMSDAATK